LEAISTLLNFQLSYRDDVQCCGFCAEVGDGAFMLTRCSLLLVKTCEQVALKAKKEAAHRLRGTCKRLDPAAHSKPEVGSGQSQDSGHQQEGGWPRT
jgi:hypothetical protein